MIELLESWGVITLAILASLFLARSGTIRRSSRPRAVRQEANRADSFTRELRSSFASAVGGIGLLFCIACAFEGARLLTAAVSTLDHPPLDLLLRLDMIVLLAL